MALQHPIGGTAGLCVTDASAAGGFAAVLKTEGRRYLVRSWTGHNHYLVDLDENNGQGWCGCEDHEFRRQPLIERGYRPGPCKHVRMALEFESG